MGGFDSVALIGSTATEKAAEKVGYKAESTSADELIGKAKGAASEAAGKAKGAAHETAGQVKAKTY